MDIVNLDEENIEMYTDYLTPDVAENVGRTFYRGLIVEDNDSPVAGMVWDVKNMMRDDDVENHISFLRIDDEEATEPLFEEYKTSVMEDGVVRSCFSLPAKASAREIKTLEREGFSVRFMEGDLIKCRLYEIFELKLIQKIGSSENIHSLKSLTQRDFNTAVRAFASKGHYGICEDLPYLSQSYFENDISCYSEKDEEVNGIFLFHKIPSGGLLVSVMAAIGNDFGRILPEMIKYSVTRAKEYYPDDTQVLIDRHNYASLALSEKFFPRGFGIPVYIGSRKES